MSPQDVLKYLTLLDLWQISRYIHGRIQGSSYYCIASSRHSFRILLKYS